MRYSSLFGVIAAILVAIGCFLPWVSIEPIHKTLTGMDPQGTYFGRPGKLHMFFCVIIIALFLIPKIWAKRANWFFCAFALAWGVRNFIIYARCELGTCPERRYGLWLVLIASLCMMFASFFPNLKIPDEEKLGEPAK